MGWMPTERGTSWFRWLSSPESVQDHSIQQLKTVGLTIFFFLVMEWYAKATCYALMLRSLTNILCVYPGILLFMISHYGVPTDRPNCLPTKLCFCTCQPVYEPTELTCLPSLKSSPQNANQLPQHARSASILTSFNSGLETLLFAAAFN